MTQVLVNGLAHSFEASRDEPLLTFLRYDLGLIGAKPGCGEGQCGACTVLVDGVPEFACQLHLQHLEGASITTIEGLDSETMLPTIQRAFVEERAWQCGYCTPGMVLRIAALLASQTHPDEGALTLAMNPNLCRCGCYTRIAAAIRRAGRLLSTAAAEGSPFPAAPTAVASAPILPPRPHRPWDLTPIDQREWFEVLGDGLVVVWPPQPAPAGMWTTSGGAWLHVAPSGAVTAFSGKVDVGQDNRSAFGLLVAEELFVAYEDVEVVLGDTDLCPFDMGTFGSRSMPDAGEALRRAAAGARRTLLALGAARLDLPTDALVTEGDGTIRGGDGESCSYGELVWGLRRIEVIEAEPTLVPATSWRFAGTPAAFAAREDTVNGSRRFVSDLVLPGMLHGAVLRPPVPGALLLSAELTEPDRLHGAETVFEEGFIGAVAPDPITARRAVAAIRARWAEPPPGPDDLEAYLRTHPAPGEGWQGPFERATGDVSSALEKATTSLSATYTTAHIAHTPLETRCAMASWDAGRLTVWTGTQVPFGVRAQVAEALGVDEALVRVVVPPTGGGFGGKHGAQVAIEAARLARRAGRPVKVHWNRSEEFIWGGLRPMAVIDVKSGLDESGSITAWDFVNINSGAAGIACPYDIPHQRLRYQPAQSPLVQVSYRALAATANHFARESHIDELAHTARADPLEFRLSQLADERLGAVLRAAAERFGWSGRGNGAGLAAGLEKDGRVATCVEVRDHQGTIRVTRVVTAYECGAVANVDTVLNQIEGATVMALGGALFERVRFEHGRWADPSLSGYRVPRFDDVPAIDVVLLDRRDLASAGAGETPMVAVAPALANAIFALTGRRLRSLPLLADLGAP